jgi:hypothetical protein
LLGGGDASDAILFRSHRVRVFYSINVLFTS